MQSWVIFFVKLNITHQLSKLTEHILLMIKKKNKNNETSIINEARYGRGESLTCRENTITRRAAKVGQWKVFKSHALRPILRAGIVKTEEKQCDDSEVNRTLHIAKVPFDRTVLLKSLDEQVVLRPGTDRWLADERNATRWLAPAELLQRGIERISLLTNFPPKTIKR